MSGLFDVYYLLFYSTSFGEPGYQCLVNILVAFLSTNHWLGVWEAIGWRGGGGGLLRRGRGG